MINCDKLMYWLELRAGTITPGRAIDLLIDWLIDWLIDDCVLERIRLRARTSTPGRAIDLLAFWLIDWWLCCREDPVDSEDKYAWKAYWPIDWLIDDCVVERILLRARTITPERAIDLLAYWLIDWWLCCREDPVESEDKYAWKGNEISFRDTHI